ncbi:MAG TPA: AAA domain-containing protein [Gemmataceae bacterium]|jgi:superfamily I DNA and/or RNA helicase|nr:AAA domain-containing protein [Gemmataceae bacterium]
MLPLEDDHFDRLSRLLDLEADAEREQAARQTGDGEGRALTGLIVRDEDAGLGGRLLLTFGKRDTSQPLPPTRLQPGSPVLLKCPNDGQPLAIRGIVFARHANTLRVAIDDSDETLPEDETWRIELAADELARRRQKAAMQAARNAKRTRLAELRDVLMGRREPEIATVGVPPFGGAGEGRLKAELQQDLNESQLEAIALALAAKDLAIIHGPPGTGKTTAVVELIRQAVARGERVLACAPSNLAVDNLLEKLLAIGENPVRLGHPARVSEALREHTLDELALRHPDAKQARKFYKEAHALFRKAGKWTRAKPEPGERGKLRREGRALIDDARKLEDRAVERILDGASILCATLTGVNAELLGERTFDLVVIDEACQSPEPACWIAIGRAKRLVLAGDHCQLPPTVLSLEAARQGLSVSLMERLVARFGCLVTRRLRVQYRMHETIAGFSSAEFYESDLIADDSVKEHRLCDLPGVASEPRTQSPMHFIDTAGAGYDEDEVNESRRNTQESALVAKQVRALVDCGVSPEQIAVIAPYSAQVKLLRDMLAMPGLEIDSVDGFQGREKEAVIFSMVRSNPEGEVGFLADVRRTNVALTRARRALIVVGDSATLANHPFYQRLLTYVESIGAYGSVWEE